MSGESTDDDRVNDAIRHVECDAYVRMRSGPEPNDPDRHGNVREFFACVDCGDRGNVLFPRHGSPEIETPGFEFVEENIGGDQ